MSEEVMRDPFENCTDVSDACPVNETLYGYAPNLGANLFFLILFSILFLVQAAQMIRFRAWIYGGWLLAGSGGELAGYAGRVLMHYNAWSEDGFMTQIATLIFSPSFYAAAIYLTLKHMVRGVGSSYSPIKAWLYPWIFIVCDFISLLLQAAGGGVAAGADDHTEDGQDTADLGGHIMLAGIVFQVFTLTFLYGIFAWYLIKIRHAWVAGLVPEPVRRLLKSRSFRFFGINIYIAAFCIYVRCVYRIAELAEGWANEIMRDEVGYIVLDGVMVAIAGICLTIAHPSWFYKPMINHQYPADLSEADVEKDHSSEDANANKDHTAQAVV